MARKSTAKSSAVYRGVMVGSFESDLSNYAQMRRGLSKTMREQTLSKTTLSKANLTVSKATTETARETYIKTLNRWRQQSQAFKKARARYENPIETLFQNMSNNTYFNESERATLAAANIKLKTMTAEQAQEELRADLEVKNRTRNQDFYSARYFLEQGEFDPEEARDDMLSQLLGSGVAEEYPGEKDAILNEYARRLGAAGAADPGSQIASEAAAYKQDILAIAKLVLYGPEPELL